MAKKSNTEFETKVLDFDPAEIIQKLRDLGAKETPEYLARRYVFTYHADYPEFIRLRDEGGRITLAYKKKDHTSTQVGNTVEIQTVVEDFDKTAEKILKLGGIVALPKFAIPGRCWQGYFLDLDGNTFGLFQVDETAA